MVISTTSPFLYCPSINKFETWPASASNWNSISFVLRCNGSSTFGNKFTLDELSLDKTVNSGFMENKLLPGFPLRSNPSL